VGVDELAGLNHGDRGGGDTGLVENLSGDAVDSILESRVERFDRLGRRGGGKRQDRKNRATQDFRKLLHRHKSPSLGLPRLKPTPTKVSERDRGGRRADTAVLAAGGVSCGKSPTKKVEE